MKLGIIGLPQSGKTTIFNALTRGNRPTTTGGGRFDVHTAVVDVPDLRINALVDIFHPKKTTYAKVTYADIAGLGGSASGEISGQLLNQLTQLDGFIHVVRCYEDPVTPHPLGSIDPQRDIRNMEAEFILNDLIVVERKLEKLAEERKRGAGRDKALVEREIQLFEKIRLALESEQPLRTVEFSTEDEKTLSGFGFLSRKQTVIVVNLAEGQNLPEIEAPCQVDCVVPLYGKLEMEIAQLEPGEAEVFLSEYGIDEPSLNRMIRSSYDLMGLQSFFTVGEDEVRAWTVRRGATAEEAAGTIHSDLQKGFIRAEVVSYDDMVRLHSMANARSQGRLRLEGRTYPVQDGEIVHVRFNL